MNSMKQSGRNTTTSKTGPVSLENGSRAAESKCVVPITITYSSHGDGQQVHSS